MFTTIPRYNSDILWGWVFPLLLLGCVRLFVRYKLLKNSEFIDKLGEYGFGIYVFHHWIAWNFVHLPEVLPIMQNHYILFQMFFTLIVFILSYLVTALSLKSKVGRFLLAG
jgi:hypothetical protein